MADEQVVSTPAATPTETPSEPTPVETLSDTIADELGFGPAEPVEGEGEGEEVEKPVTAAKPAAPEPKPAAEAKPAEGELPAPGTWTPEAKARWAALDPVVKAEVAKREQDFLKGIGEYKEAATVGHTFYKTVEPHMQKFLEAKLDPWHVTKESIATAEILTFGTKEQQIATLTKIAQTLKLMPGDFSAASGRPDPRDQKIAALEQQIQQLGGAVSQVTTGVQAQVMKEMEGEVERFADAKGPDGQLLHPHFLQIGMDMRDLLDKGLAKDLEDAYTQAVWRNPATRDAEVKRISTAESTKAARLAQEQAAARRKATRVNVSSRDTGGGMTSSKPGSIEDTLKETLAEIKTRH